MKELQLISTRRLDVIDITRKPDKPKRKHEELTVVHGAMLGIILAELLMIAVLIPV